jgi:hypothetical protein
MSNQLVFSCRAVSYNGYPKIQLFLDGAELPQYQIESDQFELEVLLDAGRKKRTLEIHRYGKTLDNLLIDPDGCILQDQILEIVNIKIDGIDIPQFLIQENSCFKFDNQQHAGSCYFGPNGVWTFEFETPIIEFVLDQKILHESRYSQDYLYSWSYKLGPNSVSQLTQEIDSIIDKVNALYE